MADAHVTIDYPVRDGKRFAETDIHAREMVALFHALKAIFIDDDNVYVAMDNFLYYVEGDPKKCVSPDVYVVKGVKKGLRDCYFVWKEGGRVPTVVFEITSKSTAPVDLQTKMGLYEKLGVAEYFLFDPKREYLQPPAQGYRLDGGKYVRLEPNAKGELYSEELGLILAVRDGGMLRLIDPATGKMLPRYEEFSDELKAELKARRDAEIARRIAEEARRDAEAGKQREAERRRAVEAARQQEAEQRRVAEAELARLKEQIARLTQGKNGTH